ncbi:MAG: glycosyltransferase [Gordonia polyisoprenivorans]|nr:glycosyltransferase [Gordonia polyisoprenivorans]
MMTVDSPVVLLSAFVMHPTMTSEPGIGWRFLLSTARAAARRGVRVVVVTNRRSYEACVDAVPADLAETIELQVVDLPVQLAVFRWQHPRFTRIEHEMWVAVARPHVRALAQRRRIVYAHHVTFASDLLSTPITALRGGVPIVWGPVGVRGQARAFLVRPRFPGARVHAALEVVRNMITAIASRRVIRHCHLVLAQSDDFARGVSRRGVDCRPFPNLLVRSEFASAHRSRRVDEFRLLFVGHVIERKRPDLAVALLSDPRLAESTLTIVGNRETDFFDHVVALAGELGVDDRVTFTGPLDPSGVREAMENADVLVHLSAREGAPGVVAEAAVAGLPVVCFDGTGGASVLRYCGGPGVTENPATATISSLTTAVLSAAMEHGRSGVDLGDDRFQQLAEDLLEWSVARRAVS